MTEIFGFKPPEPSYAYQKDSGGSGSTEKKLATKEAEIAHQIDEYCESCRRHIQFDHEKIRTEYGDDEPVNPNAEIVDRAESIIHEAVSRQNAMADQRSSSEYLKAMAEQEEMKDQCEIGEILCIDGRRLSAHTSRPVIGISKTMAGIPDTYTSKITGETMLASQSLQRIIEERPNKKISMLLQILEAHADVTQMENGEIKATSNCGAMKIYRDQEAARGEPFESDDLILENFKLMEKPIQAITEKYNTGSRRSGKDLPEQVAIRTVMDINSQGILLGYGDTEQPFFTTSFLKRIEDEMKQDLLHDEKLSPGYYRQSFTMIDRFAEKEMKATELIRYFLNNQEFVTEVGHALSRLSELQGLNKQQQQALKFTLAKTMAFQWQTSLYKKEFSQNHPYLNHNEQFMAISLDDGYGATVGESDPELQVFTANTASVKETIKTVKTKKLLMSQNPHIKKPYVLFICGGIAQNAIDNPEVLKQSRATLARNFTEITQQIAEDVTPGIIFPVAALVENRSGRVIEIPNLKL